MKLSEFITEKINYSATTHDKNQHDYVLGNELEKTAAYGKKTIVVSNVSDLDKLDQLRTESKATALYFYMTQALNKSKNPEKTFKEYKKAVKHFLDKKVLCTLDIPVEFADKISDLSKSDYFIANIVIKLPNIKSLNSKAAIKLQGDNFGDSNGGVWVTNLKNIMVKSNFTPWSKYNKDHGVDLE